MQHTLLEQQGEEAPHFPPFPVYPSINRACGRITRGGGWEGRGGRRPQIEVALEEDGLGLPLDMLLLLLLGLTLTTLVDYSRDAAGEGVPIRLICVSTDEEVIQ